ncbi:MAG: hypothetical protein U0441_37675 [Polyangiaceae bacterium]
MKERAPETPIGSEWIAKAEVTGRARRGAEKVSEGQLWTLDVADEKVADRLLSLGIAGIGGFVDGGRTGATVWLVRKLPETTLADRVRERRGAWPAEEALAVGLAVARGLAACERLSLFPGPISPEEIASDERACAVRAEAFVRSLLGARDAGPSALSAQVSPRWTPPEQAGGAVWNSAANRYVLGLVMYRLLGGEHAFGGAGLRHALEEAAQHEPPPFVESVARDLPAGLQSFVLRMLAPDADARPASAQAIVDALTGFLRGEDGARPHARGPRETAADRDANARPAATGSRPARAHDPIPPIHPAGFSAIPPVRAAGSAAPGPRPARAHDPSGNEGRSRSVAAPKKGAAWVRLWPLAAAVGVAGLALTLLAPPPPPPRATAAIEATRPLAANETTSQDCAKCHSRQTAEWRRSVMAHAVKSPLFNGLEMVIEEQFARDFDCPNGAGALRRADPSTACRVAGTGQLLTGTGGEHWCISCHSPSENLESRMPAWDGRPGGDARSRRPPHDLLGERAMEGISCGFCHEVHGPVGPRSARGYQGNPTWTSPFTGTTFPARPEDDRGLFGIANSGYDLRPEELILGARGSTPLPSQAGAGKGVDPIVHARPSRAASSYLGSSEFCGTCHDVRLFGTDVLNAGRGEHFKRLRNAYSEWVDWAKREERAGRAAASCQDCHMTTFPGVCAPAPETIPAAERGDPSGGKWAGICPPGTKFEKRAPGSYPKALAADNSPEAGDVVTHYFSGVDVPLAREYPEALVDEGSVDVNGVPLSAKKRRDLLLRAAFRFDVDGARRSGSRLEVPVVIENTGAGHKVPAGFSQEREIWVQLTIRDGAGTTVYEVGRVGRGDEDLHDKVFERVNTSDAFLDGKGHPLGLFGADVRDGPDVQEWDPPPATGATRMRGKGLINFQNGFLRCVRCIGEIAADGSCRPGPGQGFTRADRFEDGDYDLDTGECRSNLTGMNALFETYFPVGALDARRGLFKGPDAIIDTRSMPPGVPIEYTYDLATGGRRGPFRIEARLLFRAFPPFLVKGFIEYEREQARKGLRPNGPLVTEDALRKLEIVEVARASVEVP